MNFGDQDQWVPFAFPASGDCGEELHGRDDQALNLEGVAASADTWLLIPSNYGRVWTLAPGS